MSKTVNTALWIVLYILFLPSFFAIASWNSLPGSRMFAVKLWMEQGLLMVAPGTQARSNLQIAYTERRFSEAKSLLATESSVEGLSYLTNQVDVTRDTILKTKDPVLKKELAKKYVATLQEVHVQLEQQKQVAQTSAPPTAARTAIPTRTPTSTSITPRAHVPAEPSATPIPPVVSPAPSPSTPEHVVNSISQTQQNIADTIEDIEEEIEEAVDDEPGNSQWGNQQGQGQGQGQWQGQGQGNQNNNSGWGNGQNNGNWGNDD